MVFTSPQTPIVYNNDNFVDLIEVTNSITSKDTEGGGTVSESHIEQLITRYLSLNYLPIDVSGSINQTQTITVTGGKETFEGIMISNNEDLLESELMALKLSYTTNNTTTNDQTFTYSMANGFSSNIVKKGSSVSYENSILKIDVSFNCEDQSSVIHDSNTPGDWDVHFIREKSNISNYFAAINSHLNTVDSSYPMYLSEIVKSDYIINDGRYIKDICGNTNEHIYDDFANDYKLATNHLDYEIDNEHTYQSSDFTMYKLVQSDPSIDLVTTASSGDLPLSANSNLDIESISLSEFETNVSNVLGSNNIQNIKDGFKIEVSIGNDNSGGFTINQNDEYILNINDNNIIDSPEFIAAGIRGDSTSMYIDVTNGSMSLSAIDICSNVTNVILKDGYEYLTSVYNTNDGSLNIIVDERTNRFDERTGTSANLTGSIAKEINVLYNCDEALAYNPAGCFTLDNEMKINPEVDVSAGIVVPTTSVSSINEYFNSNNIHNFSLNNDSVLVISNNESPNMSSITYANVSFDSSINVIPLYSNKIVFISLKNNNILSEETTLRGSDNSSIPNSLANVSIQNINLADSVTFPYNDYRIRLDNKTITDLSNSAQPTNEWSLHSTNSSDFLVANPIKTSILYDDCLFMRSNLDSSFNYTFTIATPVVTNAQSIKHRIDISYYDVDLSSDGTVSLSEKHAYLDDNDITYTPPQVVGINSVELDSNSYEFIVGLSLPESISNKSKFKVYQIITDISYIASFEPKLPFYTNIKLQSPVIHEEITNYKLKDVSDNDLPDIYLKYLKYVNGNKLSLVNITQDKSYSTTLKVNPSNCSTLKATFMGVNNDETLSYIAGSTIPDVDPFFNTETIIKVSNVDTVNLNVQVTYPTILSGEYYMIDTTNKPGENISFEAKLYTYDTADASETNDSFNNFHPYNNTWVNETTNIWNGTCNLPEATPLKCKVSISNNILTLTVSDQLNNLLATITQPRTFINDFNIIRCIDPLVITKTRIKDINNVWGDWNTNYTTATTFGNDRNIKVADGIYLKTNGKNPSQYSSVGFKLKPDRFSIEFVNGYPSINNGWDSVHYFTDISGALTNIYSSAVKYDDTLELTVHSSGNTTRSIMFDKYRGYNRISTTGGVDNITINRNTMSATFNVVTDNSGTFQQTFSNFAYGETYTVNNAVNVVNSNTSFALGLNISGNLSQLSNTETNKRIYITVEGASISWRFYNPIDDNNPNGVDMVTPGSSTLLDTSIEQLFGWKPRRITSDEYTITITYTIPEIEYNKLNESGANLYGNPINKTNWTYLGSDNLSVSNGLVLSGINIFRTQEYVPTGYTAYAVITPPQMKFDYNDPTNINVGLFPYNPNLQYGTPSRYLRKSYFITIDNDTQFTEETFTYNIPILTNGGITLKNDTLTNIQKFNSAIVPNTYNFKIVGNYIDIKYYSGSNYANTPTDSIFIGKTIDKIITDNNIEKLRTSQVYENGIRLYNLEYKQFITGTSGNQNSNFNIKLSISDAFLAPPPAGSAPSIDGNSLIISLNAPTATVASFYQANIRLIDSSFVLIIDKYQTSGVNYNALSSTTSEVFFVVTDHWEKSFYVDGTTLKQIGDVSYGQLFDVSDLFNNLQANQINFTDNEKDVDFISVNSGIVLTALSSTGITNLTDLMTYVPSLNLLSKTYYIYAQDIIRVNSLFGLPIYRVTNYGTVKTPGITTYSINLANRTQLYDTSGNSTMNPLNSGSQNNAITDNIQKIINVIPNAPV